MCVSLCAAQLSSGSRMLAQGGPRFRRASFQGAEKCFVTWPNCFFNPRLLHGQIIFVRPIYTYSKPGNSGRGTGRREEGLSFDSVFNQPALRDFYAFVTDCWIFDAVVIRLSTMLSIEKRGKNIRQRKVATSVIIPTYFVIYLRNFFSLKG